MTIFSRKYNTACNECSVDSFSWCGACINADYLYCDKCNAVEPAALMQEINDEIICSHCSSGLHECPQCGEYSRNNGHGMHYCETCTENTFVCSECQEIENVEDINFVDGNAICESCFSDNYFVCECCDDVELQDEAYTVRTGYNNIENWCLDCASRRAVQCDDCGEHVSISSGNYSSDSCGTCYCDSCMEYRSVCEQCGRIGSSDYMYYDENAEENLCESCYNEQKRRIIKDYHFKPEPIFNGGDSIIFLGLENEVANLDDASYTAEKIISRHSQDEELFYLKYDGSLSGHSSSFELVSNPCTLKYFQDEFPMNAICRDIVNDGGRSHDTQCCGLHVHISKAPFSIVTQERVCRFIYHNVQHMEKLARRSNSRWAQNLPQDYCKVIDWNEPGCRYYWLNFQNSSTIEFRGFRGTLKASTVYACLEMVHAICLYCDSYGDYEWSTFCSWCKENKESYSNLINFYNM